MKKLVLFIILGVNLFGHDRRYTGEVREFYENGKIKSLENYTQGYLQGKTILFYENGNIESEYNYEGGFIVDETKEYYITGKIKKIEKYNNRRDWAEKGLLKKIEKYYENGQLEQVQEFKENKKDEEIEKIRKWKENGSLDEIVVKKSYWKDNIIFVEKETTIYQKEKEILIQELFKGGDLQYQTKNIKYYKE